MLSIHYCLGYTRCLGRIRRLDYRRHLDHRRHHDEKSKRSEPSRMLTSGTLQPSKWIAETMIDPCSNFFFYSSPACCKLVLPRALPIHSGRGRSLLARSLIVVLCLSRMHLESLQAYKSRFAPLAILISLWCRGFHDGLEFVAFTIGMIGYRYLCICPEKWESQLDASGRKESKGICHPCELGESVGCVWISAGVWIRPFVVETLAGGFFTLFQVEYLVLTDEALISRKEAV